MPGIPVLLGTGLVSSTQFPYSIVVGGVEVAPTRAELQSIQFEDNGDDEPGRLVFRAWDRDNTLVLPEVGVVLVNETSSAEQVWMGFVQRRWYDPVAVGRYVNVEAVSVSTLLDEILVVRETRPAESDRARVLYLWGKYARWPLSGDVQFVTQTEASIAADDILGMTLRSALKFTAGLAGSTTRFSIDPLGRLHWFAGSEVNDAPYDVNRTLSPGAGEIAPDAIRIERDGVIKNRAYVRGATSAGSGWFQDDASVAAYGPRETFIDAPSADTAAKAASIARLYFGRVAQPRTRGRFEAEEPYNGWRAGQNVTITDAANDLAADVFRLARVTTTFTKGTGTKKYLVEFGAVRARGSDIETDLLGKTLTPGQAIAGDVFDNNGNLLLSTGVAATGLSGFGPAVRRYVASGIYNGDFALPPPFPDSSIVEDWNPLPFWRFVQASGTAITALSVEDSGAGSGRVLRFEMAAGAAGDDSYLEQIIPINASGTQAFAYRARVGFEIGTGGIASQAYVETTWLAADGVTTIGTTGAKAVTMTPFAGGTLLDISCAPGTADGNTGGQVPADAYFVRLRLGMRRDAAATSAIETLTVHEAHSVVGVPELAVQDTTDPTTQPARILKQSGVLHILGAGANASGQSAGADLQLSEDYLASGRHAIVLSANNAVASTMLTLGATNWAISAASDNLTPGQSRAAILNISGGPLTLTSTPTIANGGVLGEVLVLHNTGADSVTIQSEGTLAGSNLRLTTNTFTMGQRDSITLLWDGSDWIEIARSNVL